MKPKEELHAYQKLRRDSTLRLNRHEVGLGWMRLLPWFPSDRTTTAIAIEIEITALLIPREIQFLPPLPSFPLFQLILLFFHAPAFDSCQSAPCMGHGKRRLPLCSLTDTYWHHHRINRRPILSPGSGIIVLQYAKTAGIQSGIVRA